MWSLSLAAPPRHGSSALFELLPGLGSAAEGAITTSPRLRKHSARDCALWSCCSWVLGCRCHVVDRGRSCASSAFLAVPTIVVVAIARDQQVSMLIAVG